MRAGFHPDQNLRATTQKSLSKATNCGLRGVRSFKGLARATAPDGKFRTVILMGLDDSTLAGAPHQEMLLGTFSDLDQVDSVVIDRAGYLYYLPDEPPHTHISVQVYSGIW